jgi:hypothetical protein
MAIGVISRTPAIGLKFPLPQVRHDFLSGARTHFFHQRGAKAAIVCAANLSYGEIVNDKKSRRSV